MSEDLVIFVRCDSAEEKRALAAAKPIASGMEPRPGERGGTAAKQNQTAKGRSFSRQPDTWT
jgi:hypothetical protein